MTATDICNIALSYIAKKQISSIEENTQEARLCKLQYDHTRRILLRDYSWNFAKKHADLAKLDLKIRGWQYAYAYPNDCIAIRFIYNAAGAEAKEYERTQFDTCLSGDNVKIITTNMLDAKIEYTADIVDVGLFSDDFCEAFTRLLASNIALNLTGNSGIADAQYQLFQMSMQRAKVGNFYEQQKDTHFPTGYADARY